MKPAHRTFARQHQARQHRVLAQTLSQNLVHAGGGEDLATTLRTNARQDTGGALGMAAYDIIRMRESMDEIDFLFHRLERCEGGA